MPTPRKAIRSMKIRCKGHLLAFDVDEGQAVQAALHLDGVGSAGLGRVPGSIV